MRRINYPAALGTICIFIGIYAFKAAVYKKAYKEQTAQEAVKKNVKIGLLILSVVSMAVGLFLIGTSLRIL
jgi:NO-binding membrane sensor protein with MHYT domain